MATKAMNFKFEESDIIDMKNVASIFNMSLTDLVKNAVRNYITELKNDPFYRLTVNVMEADEQENQEILDAIDNMSTDDLTIVKSKQFTV